MKKEKVTLKELFRIAKGLGSGCCEEKTNKNLKNLKASKSCCELKNK